MTGASSIYQRKRKKREKGGTSDKKKSDERMHNWVVQKKISRQTMYSVFCIYLQSVTHHTHTPHKHVQNVRVIQFNKFRRKKLSPAQHWQRASTMCTTRAIPFERVNESFDRIRFASTSRSRTRREHVLLMKLTCFAFDSLYSYTHHSRMFTVQFSINMNFTPMWMQRTNHKHIAITH